MGEQTDDTIILFKVKTDIRLVHVKQNLAERQQRRKEPWAESAPHNYSSPIAAAAEVSGFCSERGFLAVAALDLAADFWSLAPPDSGFGLEVSIGLTSAGFSRFELTSAADSAAGALSSRLPDDDLTGFTSVCPGASA